MAHLSAYHPSSHKEKLRTTIFNNKSVTINQRDFTPQARFEEAFIYIIHKSI